MKPALVLLAAGASERLGECKALASLAGATPLQRLVDAARNLDGLPPLVVTGAHHQAILQRLPAGCEILHNPDWQQGRTGGIQLAVRRRPGIDLCLAPVDVPLVPRAVFDSLASVWESAGAPARGWLSPRYRGRGGHPVVVGRDLLALLEDFSADQPLRELHEEADPHFSLEVESAEILDDLDSPEDLAALRKRIEAE